MKLCYNIDTVYLKTELFVYIENKPLCSYSVATFDGVQVQEQIGPKTHFFLWQLHN